MVPLLQYALLSPDAIQQPFIQMHNACLLQLHQMLSIVQWHEHAALTRSVSNLLAGGAGLPASNLPQKHKVMSYVQLLFDVLLGTPGSLCMTWSGLCKPQLRLLCLCIYCLILARVPRFLGPSVGKLCIQQHNRTAVKRGVLAVWLCCRIQSFQQKALGERAP